MSARGRGKPKAEKPVGRPSKLEQILTYTDEKGEEQRIMVKDAILRAIRLGVPQRYAAQAAGINEHTLSRWISLGREWMDEPETAPAKERPFAQFAHDVERAKGGAVAYHVAVLRKAAGQGSWRASLAWLQTQAPQEFRPRIDVGLPGDRKPAPLAPETEEEAREAFVSAFAKELPELDPSDFMPEDLPNDGGGS